MSLPRNVFSILILRWRSSDLLRYIKYGDMEERDSVGGGYVDHSLVAGQARRSESMVPLSLLVCFDIPARPPQWHFRIVAVTLLDFLLGSAL